MAFHLCSYESSLVPQVDLGKIIRLFSHWFPLCDVCSHLSRKSSHKDKHQTPRLYIQTLLCHLVSKSLHYPASPALLCALFMALSTLVTVSSFPHPDAPCFKYLQHLRVFISPFPLVPSEPPRYEHQTCHL